MIRLSNISSKSFLGQSLRSVLKVIPKQWTVPVLQGPLRGTRWIVGAQTHGMWLGSYEADKQLAIARELRPGQIMFDIGANVGFFALLGAKRVGPSGRVVAVEPLARNVDYLKRHCEINGYSNILIVPKAVSDFSGTAHFSEEGESTSRLSAGGNTVVEVTTLDDLASDLRARPDLIKVDVEGAEIGLLRGGLTLLADARPVIYMAVHSADLFEELLQLAPTIGYRIDKLDGHRGDDSSFWDEVVLRPAEGPGTRRKPNAASRDRVE